MGDKILPIYGYGNGVLKKPGKTIPKDFEGLKALADNMFATMYNAQGVGLAGPQVGKSLKIFVVDTLQMDEKGEKGVKKAFVNPEILEESGDEWSYEEGCLSIPQVHGDVDRKKKIKIRYQDVDREWHEDEFDGLDARVIQHEYDHIMGVLFTEHLKPLRKRMVRRKLEKVRKGKVKVDYPIHFAQR
ncbi:MAG: peptide deformylase [Bacteroidetes bacterium]|jgi:peptide deformylase|nr:peptide deformylase [Bacteroidota bacterium]